MLKRSENPRRDHVLFAHEGFVAKDSMDAVAGEAVQIIQLRCLSDGPFIQMASLNWSNADSRGEKSCIG